MNGDTYTSLVRFVGNLVGAVLVLFALTTITADAVKALAYAAVGIGCLLIPMAFYGIPCVQEKTLVKKGRK